MKKKRRGPRHEVSSVLDPLRRFFRVFAPPGFEAFRPEEAASPGLPPPQAPPPGLPAPAGRALVPREEAGPPAPLMRRAAEMFRPFERREIAPLPPEEPMLPAPAPQPTLWEALFAPSPAAELAPEYPEAEPFRAFAQPEEARPVRWVPIPVRLPRIVPSLAPGVAGWTPPDPEELAERFRGVFDLPATFEYVRSIRATPQFWWAIQSYSPAGFPAKVPVMPVIHRAINLDFALLFGIPGEVIDSFYAGVRNPWEERQADERISNELFHPLIHLLTEAFELLKPDDLPGWFTLEHDEATGQYWLTYVEALIPAPGPRRITWRGGP